MTSTITVPSARTALTLLLTGALLVGTAGCAVGPNGAAPTPSSPLEPYFDALYGGDSADEMDARNEATQDLAAQCMKDQGFPYRPDAASGTFLTEDDDGPEWGSREFAEQYGYGIVSSPYSGQQGEWVDPNADYLATLSAGERTAWEEALYGAPVVAPDGSLTLEEPTEYDWTTAGCLGSASHQAELDSGAPWADPELADLLEELQNLSTETAASDAVVAAEQSWSDCLASAGHPGFEHKQDPSEDVSERYGELTRPETDPGDATSPPPAPSESDSPALAALQKEEITLAVADDDCSASSGYDDALAAEQHRRDQEFVDTHRTELDALLAKHGRR